METAVVTSIAASFAEIASRIEGHAGDEPLRDVFTHTQALCQQAAGRAPSSDLRQLLTNVQAALTTWHQVWPRLGAQRDFRAAVAREARLWSKKLSEGTRRSA